MHGGPAFREPLRERPACKQPAVDADEPAPAAADQEEANEADALWWRLRLWVFLYSISKAFRPGRPGSTDASTGPGPRSALAT
jgi:hypothetical protein